MCTYEKKQQFSPLYSYQKFPRSGQKIGERSQATEPVFWEINYPKIWTGSLSEVYLEAMHMLLTNIWHNATNQYM